ncbi:MAG TPA: hypothetical protein VMU59_11165 [Caulobacteraceae bacterium]|nr:hypothetical protein [Caulobacteraceae bacterium]
MSDIRIDDALWTNGMTQQAILDHWCVANLEPVHAGQPVALVIIQDARHEILAPIAGLLQRRQSPGAVLEPGDVLASVSAP